MSLETVKSIHKKVYKLFQYVPDIKQYDIVEHWASHKEEVKENKKFKDDCDGFALTCAELCVEAGIPKENIALLICMYEDTKTKNKLGHLVCRVDVEENTYILDNNASYVYDRKKNPHKYEWVKAMRVSTPGKWFLIKS